MYIVCLQVHHIYNSRNYMSLIGGGLPSHHDVQIYNSRNYMSLIGF